MLAKVGLLGKQETQPSSEALEWLEESQTHENLTEPKQFCLEEWDKIPPETCAALIQRDRKCLDQFISSRVGVGGG